MVDKKKVRSFMSFNSRKQERGAWRGHSWQSKRGPNNIPHLASVVVIGKGNEVIARG